MAAVVAGIHVQPRLSKQDVSGRGEPGHDSGEVIHYNREAP